MKIKPEQFDWLKAVLENMKADTSVTISADYFLKELERLTNDDEHPFDCKCAIDR